ncbi:hypothetical protein M9H77_12357 [Catharanthus roseus]|uniref:Uncharacterized protein n=1 Tax=Catharanthus roseus TaxID=4058 RepID=A0ACC0BHC7_CATRO|nr:hypothetical protein M9H77_12357 [Catharanthus roseus]
MKKIAVSLILRDTFTQASYRSPKRNDPINQDTQRGSYPYSILDNKELVILNSWAHEFLYNLSDIVKAFSILLLTDLSIGFNSTYSWELMIGSVYKDFGFVQNDQNYIGSCFHFSN